MRRRPPFRFFPPTFHNCKPRGKQSQSQLNQSIQVQSENQFLTTNSIRHVSRLCPNAHAVLANRPRSRNEEHHVQHHLGRQAGPQAPVRRVLRLLWPPRVLRLRRHVKRLFESPTTRWQFSSTTVQWRSMIESGQLRWSGRLATRVDDMATMFAGSEEV